MTNTVALPVFLRAGDGEEVQVGTIEAASVAEAQAGIPDFLRAAADAVEQTMAAALDQEAPEGGACTASITDDHQGTLHCVLPVGHDDPDYGPAHSGPGDRTTRLRWFDWAHRAVPHRDGGSDG